MNNPPPAIAAAMGTLALAYYVDPPAPALFVERYPDETSAAASGGRYHKSRNIRSGYSRMTDRDRHAKLKAKGFRPRKRKSR